MMDFKDEFFDERVRKIFEVLNHAGDWEACRAGKLEYCEVCDALEDLESIDKELKECKEK